MIRNGILTIKRFFDRSDFVRNVFVLTSGTVFAQAVYFLSTPVLTRLYTPGQFGVFSLFVSIVAVVGIFATLTYEMAIVLPESDSAAINVLSLTVAMTLGAALLSTLLISVGAGWLAQALKTTRTSPLLWLIPLGICGFGLEQSLNFWFTRKNRFSLLASFQIMQSGGVTVLQLGMGLLQFGPLGLIGGRILGQFAALAYLFRAWWQGHSELFVKSVSRKEIVTQARAYSNFPKFNSPAEAINAFSQNVPILLLAYLFDAVIVGFYGLAFKVMALPISIVARSYRQVFYSKANETYLNKSGLYRLLKDNAAGLLKVWVPPFLVVALFGRILFATIFGSDWETAGLYAQILAPMYLCGVIIPPFVACLFILGLQRIKLYYEIALCIFRVVSLIGGYLMWKSAAIAILCFSLTGVVFNLGLVLFVLAAVKRNEADTASRPDNG